jgi:hypothetical protein
MKKKLPPNYTGRRMCEYLRGERTVKDPDIKRDAGNTKDSFYRKWVEKNS